MSAKRYEVVKSNRMIDLDSLGRASMRLKRKAKNFGGPRIVGIYRTTPAQNTTSRKYYLI